MRIINLIVVHCTATQGNRTLSPEALDLMHRRRGFNGTGYHYYICLLYTSPSPRDCS